MGLFEGLKFLFLPNSSSSTLEFLAQVTVREGGRLIEQECDLDGSTYVLINDSFVDGKNNIIQRELFYKEFDLNPAVVCGFITTNSLSCVKASSISTWLKGRSMHLTSNLLISSDEFSVDEQTDSIAVSTRESLNNSDADNETKDTSDVPKDANTIPSSGTTKLLLEQQKGNQKIIQALEKLSKRYAIKGDQFRARGYKLAKVNIERYPFEIESGEQAQKEISNVGPSIAKKIQIILDRGCLPGLHEPFDLENRLDYFTKCYGVGIYTAKKWEVSGLKTFSEASKIYPDIFVGEWPIVYGWSYYEDWLKPIPRAECKKVSELIRAEARLIDPDVRIETMGSYSRGFEFCGDIDLLFYKPHCDDTSHIGGIMESLSITLYRKGYVQCFLQLTPNIYKEFHSSIVERFKKCQVEIPRAIQLPDRNDNKRKYLLGMKLNMSKESQSEEENILNTPKLNASDKFMSLNSNVAPCRRVDFFCCKYSELGAAKIQWIGPKEFNRWLRLKAINMNLKLTQHGLFDANNVLLESFSERRIFELLKEEYIDPEERNHTVKKRLKI